MKSLNRSLVLGLSTCALMVIGATSWGSPLSGIAATPVPLIQAPQTPPPQPQPDPAQQTPAPDQAQQAPAKSASFTGTVVVVKDGDQFVLRDSSGQVYKLDDSTRAQQFEGKQVKVTGTLDADAKMIHVDSIEGAQG